MRKETNLEKIKEISIDLLYLPLEPTDLPFLVHHPFTNSPISNNQDGLLDLTKEHDKKIWNAMMKDIINNQNSVCSLEYLVQKPYKLAWFKLIAPYLDIEDYSQIWTSIYLTLEFIEGNAVLSQKDIVKNFRKCQKEYMMSEKELKTLEELPDIVPIYRGFTVKMPDDREMSEKLMEEYARGISWSLNEETAVWFSERFAGKELEPIVYRGYIRKDKILALFLEKNEDNVVVDPANVESLVRCDEFEQEC